MPKYEIEGEVYEAANPDEAYAKHDQAIATKSAMQRGAQMSPFAQGALTAAQGATFNFADEMAGLVNPQYRDVVRGATQQFAAERPMTAAGLELAGGLATAPFTGPLSLGRGVTTMGKVARTAGDIAAQGALSGAGAADEGDRLAGAAMGAGTGLAIGGGANVLGRGIRSAVVTPVASRMPGVLGMVPETAGGYNVRPDYARERLAELLERDAQARIMTGVEPGQEAVMAAARLRRPRGGGLGAEAPIAATGGNTLAEIDMLSQLPGVAGRQLTTQQRRVAAKRGGAIVETAERATGVVGSADDELTNLAKRQAEAAGPLYAKVRDISFPIDEELQKILGRARLDLGAAQRTATRRGESATPLRNLKQGDQLPFAAADQLKRTLWDKAQKKRRAGETNEAADLDRLRLDLVGKLDTLSPDYAKARSAFAGFGELETAVEKGTTALSESAESLAKLTKEFTPSELEAFRVGAVDSLRQVAGSQAGQTRLLNMYKEPELQGKLRAIFGNDFREFQRTILAQEELKKLERAGSNSATFKRLAQAQDQKDTFDLLQASQAATNPVGAFQMLQQKATQYGMPEEQRNRLAKLLMLRDEPAQAELRNMQEYMRRRAAGQALGRQVSGRVGAFGAGQE
jgi:hypothetical protein